MGPQRLGLTNKLKPNGLPIETWRCLILIAVPIDSFRIPEITKDNHMIMFKFISDIAKTRKFNTTLC